jgi:hypothetical protein
MKKSMARGFLSHSERFGKIQRVSESGIFQAFCQSNKNSLVKE